MSEWSCSLCTLLNKQNIKACVLCGTAKPRQKSKPIPKADPLSETKLKKLEQEYKDLEAQRNVAASRDTGSVAAKIQQKIEAKQMEIEALGLDQSTTIFGARGTIRPVMLELPTTTVRWDDMEKIWHHTFYNELRVAPEEHPVLMIEPIFSPKANLEKTTQIMFETFNTGAFQLVPAPVAIMYGSGRTSGISVDSGYTGTWSVPVLDGKILPHAVRRMNVGGRALTTYLISLLANQGYSFTTTAEKEIVKDMKEKKCYVCMDPSKEIKKTVTKKYELPDGQIVNVGHNAWQCPEALFNPTKVNEKGGGLAQIINDSIQASHRDLQRLFYRTVVLAGGNSMFSGLGNRLTMEIQSRAPRFTTVKVLSEPNRKLMAWVGGSILASLNTFQNLWITQDEYNEVGPSIIHRKRI